MTSDRLRSDSSLRQLRRHPIGVHQSDQTYERTISCAPRSIRPIDGMSCASGRPKCAPGLIKIIVKLRVKQRNSRRCLRVVSLGRAACAEPFACVRRETVHCLAVTIHSDRHRSRDILRIDDVNCPVDFPCGSGTALRTLLRDTLVLRESGADLSLSIAETRSRSICATALHQNPLDSTDFPRSIRRSWV